MITGDDYIAVAERLATSRNAKEADYRSAVSRAYYGAFHLAGAYLSTLRFSVPKGAAAHGWIPQVLSNAACSEAIGAGRLLRDLHAERIIADYRWNLPAANKLTDAKRAIEAAHRIRASLLSCEYDPLKGLVSQAIESYLQKRGGR